MPTGTLTWFDKTGGGGFMRRGNGSTWVLARTSDARHGEAFSGDLAVG